MVPSDTFSKIKSQNIVEIYYFDDSTQMFRSSNFFKKSMYQLDTLFAQNRHELFKRPEAIESKIDQISHSLKTTSKTVKWQLPSHLMTESKSQCGPQYIVKFLWCAPVYKRANSEIVGWLTTSHRRFYGFSNISETSTKNTKSNIIHSVFSKSHNLRRPKPNHKDISKN